MNTIGLTLTIRIKVTPNKIMSTQELIDEVSANIDYSVKGTDTVKIISTELMEVNL